MKKVFLVLFLVCSASIWMIGQNSIDQVTVIDQESGANLMVKYNDGQMITLTTRFKESQIQSIDAYGTNEFVLIIIKPRSAYDEYLINGAFKLQHEWIQDYQDRSYFKINTGLTCSQISSIAIKDEQTLSVEYETTTSSDEYFKTNTEVILGKYSLFEVSTKVHHSFIMYQNGTKLRDAIEHSPRQHYAEI